MSDSMTNEERLIPTIWDFDWLIEHQRFVTDKTGVKLVEVIGKAIKLDPTQPMLDFGDVRKTPQKYVNAELEWYLSQDLNVREIAKHAKIWAQVADKDGYINSNYGWCIFSPANGAQYENCLMELMANPESRRAAMIYNRPEMWQDYSRDGMSDFMCTFATQHMIRDGKLVSVVNMRSNDFVFGFFNDFYWQAWVHNHLLRALQRNGYPDLESGDMVWIANSLHVYERHFDMIKNMAKWCLDNA
jgi:thymidylate synthase